jgi:hypothetical protein
MLFPLPRLVFGGEVHGLHERPVTVQGDGRTDDIRAQCVHLVRIPPHHLPHPVRVRGVALHHLHEPGVIRAALHPHVDLGAIEE